MLALTVIATGSAGTLSYSWSGDSIATANNLSEGTYSCTINDTNECTTVQTVTITEPANPIDVTTSVSGTTITSNALATGYQWINCLTNLPIAGANTASFTATANGSYAVIVTQGNCSDALLCVQIANVGLDDNFASNGVSIYPNPSNGQFTLEVAQDENITITSLLGETILLQM